ncbi:MAG: autotransporter-associated beta strand repeat-containing protein [Kiritimatiellae bacterium]|nr:autotransporter-associated beta strand repeat-containing protein [Kiritimatiellia bacterium]
MKKLLMLLGFILPLTAVLADVHTWVGGSHSGGGWNNPLNWKNASGANECPAPGDEAHFNVYTDSVTANDDDAAIACSLKKITLSNWSYALNRGVELVFDFSTNCTALCSISGSGRFRKRGNSVLTLTSSDASGLSPTYGFYSIYSLNAGGIVVESGSLVMPQDDAVKYYVSILKVASGAGFILPAGTEMQIYKLTGAGDVVLGENAQANFLLQFGNASFQNVCDFSGRILNRSKVSLNVNSYSPLFLRGGESNFSSLTMLKYVGSAEGQRGMVWTDKVGAAGEVSPLGLDDTVSLAWCGGFGYLGAGETATRNFNYDFRTTSNTEPGPVVFDGGHHGGLRLEGAISWSTAGSATCMGVVTLQGSNSVPCTIAGDFKVGMGKVGDRQVTVAVVKKGSGVWRFAETGSVRSQCGVYEIEEGTLQFESIAEAGENCSLGLATTLQSAYVGEFDASKDENYAFKLGKSTSTNAVLEFCGRESNVCSTRPIELGGDGTLRANGVGPASLEFAGVSASAGGVKTLTLDGTNTADNILRETGDGKGAFSLAKTGSGNWTLEGDHTFSGNVTVKEGTLTVRDQVPCTWFRLTLKEKESTDVIMWMGGIALYDAEGRRVATTMIFDEGELFADNYHYALDYKTLQPGHVCWSQFSSTPENDNYVSQATENPALAFKLGGAAGRVIYRSGTSFKYFNENYVGAQMVFRLPEGCATPVRYDISSYSSTLASNPKAWSIEGSADGKNWKLLHSISTQVPDAAGKWYSDGTPVSERSGDAVNAGFKLDYGEASDILNNVSAYSVAASATLRTEGAVSPAISKLKIDAADGIGNISGFTFADVVEADVVGIPKKCLEMSLPFDFSSCNGFSEAEWKFTADGKADTHIMKVTDGKLKIYRRTGTKIVVR